MQQTRLKPDALSPIRFSRSICAYQADDTIALDTLPLTILSLFVLMVAVSQRQIFPISSYQTQSLFVFVLFVYFIARRTFPSLFISKLHFRAFHFIAKTCTEFSAPTAAPLKIFSLQNVAKKLTFERGELFTV